MRLYLFIYKTKEPRVFCADCTNFFDIRDAVDSEGIYAVEMFRKFNIVIIKHNVIKKICSE